jgi:hypothetical protein
MVLSQPLLLILKIKKKFVYVFLCLATIDDMNMGVEPCPERLCILTLYEQIFFFESDIIISYIHAVLLPGVSKKFLQVLDN